MDAATPDEVDDLSDPEVAGRLVVRVRRRADVSQRELAALVGVAPSTVARLETGRGLPSLALLCRILTVGGLRLAASSPTREVVPPVPSRTVRDNGGRRFPAHLDVEPPDQVPRQVWMRPRYDRPPAKGWYHLRPERDRRVAQLHLGQRPKDHPTLSELAQRRRLMRGRQPWVDPRPMAEIECWCHDACVEEACVPECTCRCEEPTLLWTMLRQRGGPSQGHV